MDLENLKTKIGASSLQVSNMDDSGEIVPLCLWCTGSCLNGCSGEKCSSGCSSSQCSACLSGCSSICSSCTLCTGFLSIAPA